MAKVTAYGEILMRLSTRDAQLFRQSDDFMIHFGGSEANVAANLAQMGISASIVSGVPDHALADYALSTFSSYGAEISYVKKMESGRFGLYFLEQGAALRGSQIIYDRDGSSFSQIEPKDFDWDKIFDGCEWFHISGISPAVSENAAHTCIEVTDLAKSRGLRVSVDLNYRKNLWKYGKQPKEVMPDIVKHADVLLGDPATINLMLGTDIPTKDYYANAEDLLNSYQALNDHYSDLAYAAMTLRTVKSADHNIVGGALYHQGEVFNAKTFDVTPIVERIGGGDAFMAALIFGLISGKDPDYTINFATTASALKMTIAGDFNAFSRKEIEAYMEDNQPGVIKR